jgi:hypothetical protein
MAAIAPITITATPAPSTPLPTASTMSSKRIARAV